MADSLGSWVGPVHPRVVTDAQVAGLPEVVRRYLVFMGAVGRPRDASFRLGWNGRFRTGPERDWMECASTQVNTVDPLGRAFEMRMRFGRIVSVVAHDTYAAGKGRMRAKLFDWFTIVDERGPELDVGELVTWLNDAILFAPSMLIDLETVWSAVDDRAFDVELTHLGTTVRGRVFVDERGAPKDFSTTDRFIVDRGRRIRARWTTPIDGWRTVGGRVVPSGARAVWHLPERSFEYAEFRLNPEQTTFNDLPPSRASGVREEGLTFVSGPAAKSGHEAGSGGRAVNRRGSPERVGFSAQATCATRLTCNDIARVRDRHGPCVDDEVKPIQEPRSRAAHMRPLGKGNRR